MIFLAAFHFLYALMVPWEALKLSLLLFVQY